MSIKLPQLKQWVQNNRTDALSINPYEPNNLWSTFNCDLCLNLGRVRPTRVLQTTTSVSNTDMTDIPIAFKSYAGPSNFRGIYTVGGSFVHYGGFTTSNFTKFTNLTGYPTNCSSSYSDMEIFNGYLYITTADTKCYKMNDSAWANFNTEVGTELRLLCVYGNRMYELKCRSGKVISWDTSDTVVTSPTAQYCLQYDPTTQTTGKFIRAAANRIWIGVGSDAGFGTVQKGVIYEWDGSSNSAIISHKIDSGAPMACVIKDDVPWVVDSNGRLLTWNGGTFKEVARLPLNDFMLTAPYDSSPVSFIHPNGMSVINGKINILVNGKRQDANGSSIERCPSGVWEYDEKIGLYHKYSPSQSFVNNNPTITDFGINRLNTVGAISEMKVSTTASNATGQFLIGASIFSDASTVVNGIFTNDTYLDTATYTTFRKAGYFITAKIESQQVTDTWQSVYLKYKRFLSSTDKLVVKYRIDEIEPSANLTITWVNTTSFTVTTSAISGWTVGDEVEILNGTGAGLCAHIVTAVDNSGTTTITIDETATGVTTGTAIARFQRWTKLGYIADQTSSWKNLTHGTSSTSTWIQYKVYMMFTNLKGEVEELDIRSGTSQSIN